MTTPQTTPKRARKPLASVASSLLTTIKEKEGEIAKLRARVEELEWDEQKAGPENDPLPVPRLEIRWEDLPPNPEKYEQLARYNLVYRHFLGHTVIVPLGATRASGGRGPFVDGKVRTPFREGAHIRSEAKTLRLPAYAVYGDKITLLTVGDSG